MSTKKVDVRSKTAWQQSIEDKDLTTSPSVSKGARYIIAGTGGAWSGGTINDIATYNGSTWDFDTPAEGWQTWVKDENVYYIFDGSSWQKGLVENTDNVTLSEIVKSLYNIVLNAFRIAINGSLSVFNMVDGVVDEFEDETGVDVGASTSEDYDSTDDYYSPSFDASSNYPPAYSVTYVKATSNLGVNYEQWLTCNPALSLTGPVASNQWLASDKVNQRFHIDLGSAKVINKIYYENSHNNGSQTTRGANNFTFWGSNTGAGTFDDLVYGNDEGWTQLTPSQSTFDEHTASDIADPKYITVQNSTAYRYYAIKIADNHGDGSYMGIRRLELQYASTGMTLISEEVEAEEQPDSARIVIFEEDVDSVTVNTDLKAYISRDDGTTWSQITLADEGDYETNKRILVGSVDISGQPADKTMRYKIVTDNVKDLKLHGIGLLWD